ncbi:hypothetical protein RAH41_22205 [Gottfriedia acidiceleris]|uniref:hypothetical protein n=1 Tax=Gottfriedia acidiceleris TaxID=371036 RepID=UPI002F26392C
MIVLLFNNIRNGYGEINSRINIADARTSGYSVILVFLLSRMKAFRQMIQSEHSFVAKMILIIILGAFT